MIETHRLRLIPCSLPHFAAILQEDSLALANLLQARLASDWLAFADAREAMPFAANYLFEHPEAAPWWFYLIVEKSQNLLIGNGGFKGCPTPEGTVELGYSIAPSRQRQGFATETTRGLLRYAFREPLVRQVDAHTLPGPNYSVQVLTKNGFTYQGTLEDPDDGLIWHWRRTRAS